MPWEGPSRGGWPPAAGGQAWAEALSFGDLVLRAAAAVPDDDAVVFPGERLSWRELAERARSFAAGLIGLGVARGVLMPNSPDTIAALFGVSLAGARRRICTSNQTIG